VVKLPYNPPSVDELQALGPDIHSWPSGEDFIRTFRQGGSHPVAWNSFRHFGPTNARFDHQESPPGTDPDRGIYYAAKSLTTCLAEAFQDTRVINLSRHAPWIAVFETTRDLELLDLTGSWPTRAGASMKINTGPRHISRAWSRQFYSAFPTIDGLYYSSSMHANEPCIALYERATGALPRAPLFCRPLSDPTLLSDIKRSARTMGYHLLP
jgi:hypothetical protein